MRLAEMSARRILLAQSSVGKLDGQNDVQVSKTEFSRSFREAYRGERRGTKRAVKKALLTSDEKALFNLSRDTRFAVQQALLNKLNLPKKVMGNIIQNTSDFNVLAEAYKKCEDDLLPKNIEYIEDMRLAIAIVENPNADPDFVSRIYDKFCSMPSPINTLHSSNADLMDEAMKKRIINLVRLYEKCDPATLPTDIENVNDLAVALVIIANLDTDPGLALQVYDKFCKDPTSEGIQSLNRSLMEESMEQRAKKMFRV